MLDDRRVSQPMRGPAPEDDLSKRLEAFVGRLESEATRRVQRRSSIETRWLEDLRQYHGIYDDDVTTRMTTSAGSRVFINLTAVKTDALVARLSDLLFPTDDRNWGVGPTPVPELTDQAEAALKRKAEADEAVKAQEAAMREADQAGDRATAEAAQGLMRGAEAERDQAQIEADELHAILDVAARAAQGMEREIDDALVGCNFAAEARDAIKDGCKIGTGVLKGPVLSGRPKRRWQEVEVVDPMTGAVTVTQQLVAPQNEAPSAHWVDPWHFFPDPDVRKVCNSEGFLERHMLSRKQLRLMAEETGVNLDALRHLLKTGPEQGAVPSYLASLSAITGQNDGSLNDRYQVWEWTGPVEPEDMALLVEAFRDDADDGLPVDEAEIDPLVAPQAKVIFCQGRVLKFGLHPLDSGDPIYSVFTVREDETSVHGYGIPYIMRDPQAVLNAAYRMMMDNSGLSTGPQIVVDKEAVTPQDGNWTLSPRKIWLRNSTSLSGMGGAFKPFETFSIQSNQAELANIITIASAAIDEVTAMPALAQGEQGAGVTKTAQGMALLMNSANVGYRRLVGMWDDEMTIPLIQRFYDWFMQFSPKESIKGDYEVHARGSSVLLVREMQSQNLVTLAQLFGDHPTYGPMLKHEEILRAVFRSLQMPADEILKTETEYKADLEKAAAEPDPATVAAELEAQIEREKMELAREEMQAKTEIANLDSATRVKVAELNYAAVMSRVAEDVNLGRDKIGADVAKANAAVGSRERSLAVEAAMAQQTGVSSGGAV